MLQYINKTLNVELSRSSPTRKVGNMSTLRLVQFIGIIMITLTPRAFSEVSYDRLVAALIVVESHGNDRAIGDRHMTKKAYGPLQIRQPCVDDVNRRFGTKIQAHELLGNRSLSKWVCVKYLEMYATPKRLGREPTMEDMARIWNGGPVGWKRQSTTSYWSKVKKNLQ